MSKRRLNILIAVCAAIVATVMAYYDISVMSLIVLLAIAALVLLGLNLLLVVLNGWLYRRRLALEAPPKDAPDTP